MFLGLWCMSAQVFAQTQISTKSNQQHFPSKIIVLTPARFMDSIQPFLDWKFQKGMDITIVQTRDINLYPDAIQIQAYLRDIYKDNPFDYLLIIGDHWFVPMFQGINGNLHDHGYSLMDTADYLPDVAVGRIPAHNEAECGMLLRKTMQYEKKPDTNNPAWFSNAMVISGNDGIDDKNGMHVAGKFSAAGFTTIDFLREKTGTNTQFNILKGLNEGKSWVFYSGHGNATGWTNVKPGFNIQDIGKIKSTGSLPVVVSVGCAIAEPGINQTRNFGETFLNTGMYSGAIALIGCTADCYFYWSDTLGKHTVFNYLQDENLSLGFALNKAKEETYLAFPQPKGGITEATLQHFILLGDPSLLPWTRQPETMQVSYRNFALKDKIRVKVFINNKPVNGARVCLSNKTRKIQISAMNPVDGTIDFNTTLADTLLLTVSGRNLKTFQTTLLPEDVPAKPEVILYPNPANETIFLKIEDELLNADISIFNAFGQIVHRDIMHDKIFKLSTVHMPEAVYFYQILKPNGEALHGRFTVIHP
jgi:gingipain R